MAIFYFGIFLGFFALSYAMVVGFDKLKGRG